VVGFGTEVVEFAGASGSSTQLPPLASSVWVFPRGVVYLPTLSYHLPRIFVFGQLGFWVPLLGVGSGVRVERSEQILFLFSSKPFRRMGEVEMFVQHLIKPSIQDQ
jgi:hypothetical protein